MKFCPFLVAGQSLQASQPRAGAIPGSQNLLLPSPPEPDAGTAGGLRFGFDPELLYLARHHGLRAVEIPVRWGHSPATKVSMLRDSIQMFIDVFTIRWNSLLGRYPRKL